MNKDLMLNDIRLLNSPEHYGSDLRFQYVSKTEHRITTYLDIKESFFGAFYEHFGQYQGDIMETTLKISEIRNNSPEGFITSYLFNISLFTTTKEIIPSYDTLRRQISTEKELRKIHKEREVRKIEKGDDSWVEPDKWWSDQDNKVYRSQQEKEEVENNQRQVEVRRSYEKWTKDQQKEKNIKYDPSGRRIEFPS